MFMAGLGIFILGSLRCALSVGGLSHTGILLAESVSETLTEIRRLRAQAQRTAERIIGATPARATDTPPGGQDDTTQPPPAPPAD